MRITSFSELNKIMGSAIKQAMITTQNEIYQYILDEVDAYYAEPVFGEDGSSSTPSFYRRSEKLLKSLRGSAITHSGNSYEFTVGWEDSYLSFKYTPQLKKSKINKNATGLDVLRWFNGASHGGTVSGEGYFWDEAIASMGGEQGIVNIFIKNLKAAGVSVQ